MLPSEERWAPCSYIFLPSALIIKDMPLLQEKEADLGRKRAAIAELYETHYERVARYIAVRIGDVEEAADLASEVFVRALRSVGSFKETGAPMEAWLFKIAHNLVVDHLRRKGRRQANVPIEDVPYLVGTENPDVEVERQQEVQMLHHAMEKLSDSQRQVLALRFGAGMSSEEAAEVLGKKPGAVREMQSAAIKKLRQILVS